MSRQNLRRAGRMLAGLMCVVGLTVSAGCSGKCCGKDGCSKQSAKKCPPGCTKPCCKKA